MTRDQNQPTPPSDAEVAEGSPHNGSPPPRPKQVLRFGRAFLKEPADTQADDDAGPDPWLPDPEMLEEYTGQYASPELATAYTLEVRGNALVATHFRRGDRILEPVEMDRFRAPGFGEVRFLRNDSGEVASFTVNQTRIRGLRFERLP